MWWLKVITFLSAFLLFQIELVIAKLFLPHYGGSYLVWGACIVFFQAVLLAGYCFAHFSLQRMGIYSYLKLHIGLLLTALLFFPLCTTRLSFDAYPLPLVLDIFWRLLITIGPAFFVLSTMSLVTQSWLGASHLKEAHHPYALYGISNIGSLAGLLTYPFLIEPYWGISQQLQAWRVLYIVLVFGNIAAMFKVKCKSSGGEGLLLTSARQVPKSSVKGNPLLAADRIAIRQEGHVNSNPSPPDVWRWLCLGAAGVVMFLSVTNIITYEVSPVPLLWVMPLGIYLLAFILNFKEKPWCPSWISRYIGPILGMAAMVYFLHQKHFLPIVLVIIILCVFLFLVCIYTQHQLILSRPSAEQITLFYVMMSLGGFLGGVLTSWIIPLISNTLVEYLIGLWLVGLMMPEKEAKAGAVKLGVSVFLAASVFFVWPYFFKDYHLWSFILLWAVVVVAFLGLASDKRLLALVLGGIVLATPALESIWRNLHFIVKKRNYYGIYEIYENNSGVRALIHGTTLHGMEFVDSVRRRIPLGYYSPVSAVGSLLISDIFQAKRVGIVGLGTGALSMYAKITCPVDYYELDADVHKLASKYFWYLAEAPGQVNVIVGDARLSLQKAPDASYDVLVVDAFSGDSIPTHLVNKDVLAEYRRKLASRGAIVFHITNRYLSLGPILVKIAKDTGAYVVAKDVGDQGFNMRSIWCLLTWDEERWLKLLIQEGWSPLELPKRDFGRTWSDDYSTILPIINLDELAVSLKSFNFLKW